MPPYDVNGSKGVEALESGTLQLHYQARSPAELISSSLLLVEPLIAENNLNLVRNIAPNLEPTCCDDAKLCRTLINLIGNAIKFTLPGGTITVRARKGTENGSIRFFERDTGEGIPAEALDRIFDKFVQVASRTGGRTMSSRLGLTFCKLAVEAHGGRIEVESTLGKGSTLSFEIPANAEECEFK